MRLTIGTTCALERCVADHAVSVVTFECPVTREDLRSILHSEVRHYLHETGERSCHTRLTVEASERAWFARTADEIQRATGSWVNAYLHVAVIDVEEGAA